MAQQYDGYELGSPYYNDDWEYQIKQKKKKKNIILNSDLGIYWYK